MTYLEEAQAIAREAGVLLVSCWQGDIQCRPKREFDVVTSADHAAETLILTRLAALYPEHAIVAEESGRSGGHSEYQWLVDPLDGTKNFSRHHPSFSVSLALQRGGETIAGVVYDPLRQEMFSAGRALGAQLNGRPIGVSRTARLNDALLTTSFPSARRHASCAPDTFYRLGMQTQGYRRTGSTALDLAYVACGRLDAFWDSDLASWDTAAGLLLILEAGGRCASLPGNFLLADNGYLHEMMKSAITG